MNISFSVPQKSPQPSLLNYGPPFHQFGPMDDLHLETVKATIATKPALLSLRQTNGFPVQTIIQPELSTVDLGLYNPGLQIHFKVPDP